VRLVVDRVADFPPGGRRIVRVDGREIGVFRVGDDFYAVRNRCPHQGGPLCAGRLVPRVVSGAPGAVAIAPGAPRIACPWHGWQYELDTGSSYASGDPAARSYEVTVEAGRAIVQQLEEGEAGPYVAETFEVYVEDDYVVLDASRSRGGAAF